MAWIWATASMTVSEVSCTLGKTCMEHLLTVLPQPNPARELPVLPSPTDLYLLRGCPAVGEAEGIGTAGRPPSGLPGIPRAEPEAHLLLSHHNSVEGGEETVYPRGRQPRLGS
jgi:hypothetical protein